MNGLGVGEGIAIWRIFVCGVFKPEPLDSEVGAAGFRASATRRIRSRCVCFHCHVVVVGACGTIVPLDPNTKRMFHEVTAANAYGRSAPLLTVSHCFGEWGVRRLLCRARHADELRLAERNGACVGGDRAAGPADLFGWKSL